MGRNNIIAISSTHGTGKSSISFLLAAAMKLKGYNVALLDEVARRCPLPISQKSDIDTEKWIICTHIAKEIELSRKFEYVICDRSVIDPYSYAKTSYPNYEETLSSGLLQFLQKHIFDNYLTSLILDKDAFSYQKDDGVRDLDPEFRSKVYHTILDVTKSLNLPHKVVYNTDDLLSELTKCGLCLSLPIGLGTRHEKSNPFGSVSDAHSETGANTDKRQKPVGEI